MKQNPRHTLSVIIPAYKQEKTIERDLIQIRDVLRQIRHAWEIIVVVDGKSDRTFEIASKLASKDVIITGYDRNFGKGHAVRFGMARARGDIVAFIDSGMDLKPNGLSLLLEHFEWYNADIIVGSKLHPASKVHYPFIRHIMSWGYRTLVRLLFGLSIRDTQVGMKFFRRRVLEDVMPRLLVKTYAFDIEMLAVAHYLGYKRIYEAPIELDFSDVSSIASKGFWSTISHMLWDTLAVFYRLKVLRYYATGNKRKWKYEPELNFRVNLP